MNRRTADKIGACIVGGFLIAAVFSMAAEARAEPRFVGHRARTWPDRSHTNENTVAALKVLATADKHGFGQVWAETDTWRLRDGTNLVWHDPTWGGAAGTLPPGLTAASYVRDATWPQAQHVRTTGGARAVTLPQFIAAAGRYGIGTVLVEVKNSIGREGPVHAAARAAGVNVWMYKPDVDRDCRVAVPDWHGDVIGVKVDASSRCTPRDFHRAGVSVVTEMPNRLTRNRCAVADGYRRYGITVIARGANQPIYRHQLEPCGVNRMIRDRPDQDVKKTW